MNAPVSEEKSDNKKLKWLLIGLAGAGAFVAMGVPMLSMMYYMSQMNVHMGNMVGSIESMSGDMADMKNYLRSMNIGVISMDNNIDDIEASIVAMDDNILTINSAIQDIQHGMSVDLSGMRQDVGHLNTAVQHMSGNVSGMNMQMDQMRRDIGYGTSTFTQPWNLMRNMMP